MRPKQITAILLYFIFSLLVPHSSANAWKPNDHKARTEQIVNNVLTPAGCQFSKHEKVLLYHCVTIPDINGYGSRISHGREKPFHN